MPAVKLTRAICDAATASQGRQVAYGDSEVRGLELRVSGEGKKTWSFRYRTRLGRQARVTLGAYSPEFSPAEARAAARRIRIQVDGGDDPAATLRAAKVELGLEPIRQFSDLADAYFKATAAGRYRPKRESSLKNELAVYRVHIKGLLGQVPMENLTRRVIKGALERMLDRGVTSQAVRAQAVIRQMLTYAVQEERIPFNVIADLPPVAPARPRARIYSDAELRAIWTGIEAPEALRISKAKAERRRDGEFVTIGPPMRLALALVFLLLQRRSEVLGMRLDELDLEHGVWTLPAERMKSKRRHAVPLSPWAIRLIRQATALNAGRDTPWVFPGRTRDDAPMNGASMNTALGSVLLARDIRDGTIHDIRRTGSTLMTSERLGVSPFIRSKILGHNDAGGGAQVSAVHYDANSYMAEKRRALERWQGLLARIVGVEPRVDPAQTFGAGAALGRVFSAGGVAPTRPDAPGGRTSWVASPGVLGQGRHLRSP